MHIRRIALCVALVVVGLLPRIGFAHPMGNFSVNHYSKLTLERGGVEVKYIIDLAEIPTYQELQQGNIQAIAGDPAVVRYVSARGQELGRGLSLSEDGKPLALRLRSSDVIFPAGAGGLPTMKMGFVFQAAYGSGSKGGAASLRYRDNNFEGHAGWKEIVAVAAVGSLVKSSVPVTDRSAELSNYPTDLLSSPPQDIEAVMQAELAMAAAPVEDRGAAATARVPKVAKNSVGSSIAAVQKSHTHARMPEGARASTSASTPVSSLASTSASESVGVRGEVSGSRVEAASAPLHLRANQQQTPRSRFTELITAQHLSPWFLFTAALIAAGLGALHALEPGHGKTIVGAYLVGSRGTARHAVLLGLIVTASHTAGVFALGAVTLYASKYIVPAQLYPWLGVLSGITIAGLGCYMLLRRLTGTVTEHSHASGESHGQWFSFSKKAGNGTAAKGDSGVVTSAEPLGMGQLLALGVTGGIIPCPAALIVLLSAFALHRVGLGFFLIVAFSVGLAAVLIGFGMLMVSARRFMAHLKVDGPLTTRWLPVASAAFITVLGVVLTVQAFGATQLNFHMLSLHMFSKERLGPLLFVTGLGLILGMRHSTDADHVVAISTIVTKQRSIRNAAFIGSVWGLGHTITIFIVGSLIILFGVEIPPRIGLSMEFCVAIMLVLLGILNLTGVMQKMTTRWTKAPVVLGSGLPDGDGKTAESLLDRTVGRFGLYQCVRPLVIGLVHGLAGSAAVALLVLSTIHSPVWATVYLLIFGAGTMIGMMMMTAAMAVPLTFAGDRFTQLSRYMGLASGMVSLCFGSFLVYQLGFLGGLFTGHPQWTPR